jgi:hypothetical protein
MGYFPKTRSYPSRIFRFVTRQLLSNCSLTKHLPPRRFVVKNLTTEDNGLEGMRRKRRKNDNTL